MEDEEGKLVDALGCNKIWRDKKGLRHRLDGPAVVYWDGEERWYKHGQRHRDEGPAVEWPIHGIEQWWKDGEPYEPSAHELMVWKMKKKQKEES